MESNHGGRFEFDRKTLLYALVCALGPYASATLLVLLWRW